MVFITDTPSADTGIGLVAEGSGGRVANSLFVGSTQPRPQNQTDEEEKNRITRQEGGNIIKVEDIPTLTDKIFQSESEDVTILRCPRGVGGEVHCWGLAPHQCQVLQLWRL